jgi:hypothetical protein
MVYKGGKKLDLQRLSDGGSGAASSGGDEVLSAIHDGSVFWDGGAGNSSPGETDWVSTDFEI